MNMACFLSSKRVSYTRDIHARFLGKLIPKMAFMAIMALLAVFSCLVKEKCRVSNSFIRLEYTFHRVNIVTEEM